MYKFTDWKKRIASLDGSISPIANRPIDITHPDWVTELQNVRNPLDEAGVRTETESLLAEVIECYPGCDDPSRQNLLALFADHRSFTWAAALPYSPTTDEYFRSHLILFSLKDQGRDTRDAILELESLCETARSAGVNVGPILKEVADISSDVDKYGMGPTRSLLLHEYEKQK